MTHRLFRTVLMVAAAAVLGSCTMKEQEAPPLTGPSEFGTSVTVSVSPDILPLDGASQSVVTVRALDANSQPIRSLSLRAEILLGFQPMDFGTLSARNLVTDTNGRATLVYTAPPGNQNDVDAGTVVTIAVTPIGADFMNSAPRFASIRLVPVGIVLPPDGLRPQFAFAPSAPTEGQSVRFEACPDTAPACAPGTNPVASYAWTFGDGRSGQGRVVNHSFATAGPYLITLTIGDAYGRQASTVQTIVVDAGTGPTVAFVVIPTSPFVGQVATFDASNTRPGPGRTIVSYSWDFGDGDTKLNRTTPTTTHDFQTAGSFTVTLTVTDDLGRTAQTTQSVTVRADSPVANFTFSPPNPVVNTNILFTSTSTAPPGRTIVSYFWNFGDGTTSTAASPTKSYGTANSYQVTLGVTDSAGRTATVTRTVTVQ